MLDSGWRLPSTPSLSLRAHWMSYLSASRDSSEESKSSGSPSTPTQPASSEPTPASVGLTDGNPHTFKYLTFGTVPRPALPIELVRRDGEVLSPIRAIVDSGADATTLP